MINPLALIFILNFSIMKFSIKCEEYNETSVKANSAFEFFSCFSLLLNFLIIRMEFNPNLSREKVIANISPRT